MMADTPWGMVFVLGPFVVWGAMFFVLVHKSLWASLVLLGGVAYFQWQVALAMLVLIAVFRAIKIVRSRSESAGLQGSELDTIDGVYGPTSIDVSERARWGKGIGIGLGDD